MAKFLDNSGLSYFVDKLKAKFVTQSDYGLPIYYVETGDVPSGGITTEVIFPEQSVTATTPDSTGYTVNINVSEVLVEGENYIVTMDGTSYLCYAHAKYGGTDIYLGDDNVIWGNASQAQYPFCCATWGSGVTAWGVANNTAHTVKIEKVLSFDSAELGTKTITQNGTYSAEDDDYDGYSEVTVNVSGGSPALQSKTATPTTSQQTITPDSGYDGLSQVTVNAMPSGTAGTPTATKGSVSNHSITVTPSVTNTAGYISGGTKTGTAVTVSASELVSGSQTITQNGTVDVTNLEEVVVNVSGGSVNIGTATTTNSSNQNTSIDFTLPSGRTPKAFFCRLTSQIARNSSSRYYYVYDMRWDGSSTGGVEGNTFYMYNGTLTNVTSGYSKSQSNTTFTLSSTGSRSASPGSFFNGTYELVYVY